MPVLPSDLKLYQASTMAVDPTTANIGGAISGTQITGGSAGEVFFTELTDLGLGKTQFEKIFYQNTNGSFNLLSGKIWISNLLLTANTFGTAEIISTSSSDNGSFKIRLSGINSDGAWTQEELRLQGLLTFDGLTYWNQIQRAEYLGITDNLLYTAYNDIQISQSGQVLGKIPSGFSSATHEVTVALEASLNSSVTTTNSLTSPAGLTFSESNNEATSIAIGSTMTPSDAIGIWLNLNIAAGMHQTTSSISVIIVIIGVSS